MLKTRLTSAVLCAVMAVSALPWDGWAGSNRGRRVEVHDYVIVGGGTAGLTTAYLLAKDGKNVVVLERGPDRDNDPNVNKLERIGFLRPTFWQEYFQVENGKPGVSAVDNQTLVSGRLLGGTSSVNESVYWRPNQALLNQYGGLFADATYVNQVFKSMETFKGDTESPALRGDKGPFAIFQGEVTPFGSKIANAVSTVYQDEFGISIPVVNDWNVVEGPAMSPRVQMWVDPDTDARQSSSIALLKETNVKVDVRTEATVTKVLLAGRKNRAYGVRYVQGGKSKIMYARKKVILAAGVNSPRLLKLSGIGDRAELENVGIHVRHDNPHVGQNLHNHLQLVIPIGVPDADNTDILANRNDKGIAVIGSVPLPDDANLADRPLELATIKFGFLQDVTLFVAFLNRTESRGFTRLFSKDALAPRIVDHQYLSDAADIDDLVQAARIIKKTTEAAGYNVLIPIDFSDDAAVRAFVIENQDHAAHWGGQSAIGSVVDTDLHVIGTKNLMVADYSVAPIPMRGHSGSVAKLAGVVAYSVITGNTDVDFEED